jgi:hypothetical protein
MSTQALGGPERSRMVVALVALAFALAVFLLATQATSLWSSRATQLPPTPMHEGPMSGRRPVNGSHIPASCWVKYGCDRGEANAHTGLASGRQLPEGCRVKFGC